MLCWSPLPAPIAYRLLRDRLYDELGDFHLPEIVRELVLSALARGDEKTAEMFIRDNLGKNQKPTVQISKFSPGEHFYVFREKFDSREAAEHHARAKGYRILPGIHVQSMNELVAARADRPCLARSEAGAYCRSAKGHDGVHVGPNPVDPESSVWWEQT